MANQIDVVKEFQKEIAKITEEIKLLNTQVLAVSKSSREAANSFKNIKTPKTVNNTLKEVSDNTEQLNAVLKEQNQLEKSLISTIAKKELATESTNRAVIKQRFELQQQNKLIKEASVISSRYSTLLQKTTAQRNKLAKTIQDLNLKRELGIKLSNKEQKELKESTVSFDKYDKAVRKAKESVGRFQENVGNYPKTLGSIRDVMTGLIGSFGLIEGLRLGVDFGLDAIRVARQAKGVQFAFERLGTQGVEAFEDIKKATRGTLSDLDIKKALNEFKNLGIGLDTAGVAFEFLSVRAAQTGRTVDSLREDLVSGLGRGSVKLLDNLGLSMAELNKITKETGVTVQQAFGIIAKKEIAAAGGILDEATSSQEKFNAALENFKVKVGSGFISDFSNAVFDVGAGLTIMITKMSEASDILDKKPKEGSFFSSVARGLNPLSFISDINSALQNAKDLEALDLEFLDIDKTNVNALEAAIDSYKDLQSTIDKDSDLHALLDNQIKKVTSSLTLLNKEKATVIVKDKEREKTVAALRLEIIRLTKIQDQLTIKDGERADQIAKDIKLTRAKIKEILREGSASKKSRTEAIALSDILTKTEVENAEGITAAQKKQFIALQKLRKLANEPFDENGEILDPDKIQADVDKIVGDLKEIEAARKQLVADDTFKEALVDLSDTFDEFTDISGDKLLRFFDSLDTNGAASLEELGEIANASFSLIADVSDSFFQSRIDGYDADIEASNAYYDNLLSNENNSAELNKRLQKDKKAAEDKLLADQAKERKKQFLANKAFAIAEVVINTAISVSKAAGQTGIFGLAAAIPLIALGALQTGLILAQPTPKFAEGGTMTHDGAMMINDHSSGRLEVVERDGKLLMTNERNAIVEGKKGDIIHKDAEVYFNNLSDDDILSGAKNHSMIATLNHQNNVTNKLSSKKANDAQKIHTDRIVKAVLSKRTQFNVQNNVSLSDDLRYLNASNEY